MRHSGGDARGNIRDFVEKIHIALIGYGVVVQSVAGRFVGGAQVASGGNGY